jgi:assimilatory nitrate reductase catalytic subunit
MTRTGQSARLSGQHPEPFVEVHALDAARFGLTRGDLAEVVSAAARIVVRVEITDTVAPGQVFVPMHWGSVFASNARVGALIAPAVDPLSGQPELKSAPVRVRRYEPQWYAFVLSRQPLAAPPSCSYVAVSRGAGHWRYELAGEATPASWSDWADGLLGARASRIELSDPAGGRYRGASVVDERLQSCLFVATAKSLPSRTWLATLFAGSLGATDRLAILAGRAPQGGVETGPVVCSCFSVGRSTLLRAIRSDALVSVEAIGKALRAGTNCGSCLPELRALLMQSAAAPAVPSVEIG